MIAAQTFPLSFAINTYLRIALWCLWLAHCTPGKLTQLWVFHSNPIDQFWGSSLAFVMAVTSFLDKVQALHSHNDTNALEFKSSYFIRHMFGWTENGYIPGYKGDFLDELISLYFTHFQIIFSSITRWNCLEKHG